MATPEEIKKVAYAQMVLKDQRDALLVMNEFLREEITSLKRKIAALESNLQKPHGVARYASGCRCEVCAAANSGYQQMRRELKKKVDC